MHAHSYHNVPIYDTVVADAIRVLERGTLKMEGNVLVEVSAPTSHKLRDLGNFQIAPSLDDLLEDNHKLLHISNIPAGTSEQHLKMYLENTKRSGGGEILRLTYREGSTEARVEFRGVRGKIDNGTVKPALRDHCHERPPVLKDHYFLAETPACQCK